MPWGVAPARMANRPDAIPSLEGPRFGRKEKRGKKNKGVGGNCAVSQDIFLAALEHISAAIRLPNPDKTKDKERFGARGKEAGQDLRAKLQFASLLSYLPHHSLRSRKSRKNKKRRGKKK